MCERYNGWINRETWCIAMWLSSEPGPNEWLESLRQRAAEGPIERRLAADELRDQITEWHDMTVEDDVLHVPMMIRRMLHETGSIYRVKWWDVVQPD